MFQLLGLFVDDEAGDPDPVTIILLSARFLSFCSEMLMNFYIDKEIENDLLQECIHEMNFNLPWAWIFGFMCSEDCRKEIKTCCKPMSVAGNDNEYQPLLQHRKYPLSDGWQFKGSIFAWSFDNVFRTHITIPNTYCIGYRCFFRLVLIPAIIPAIVLMVLMSLWILVQNLFCSPRSCCKCVCDRCDRNHIEGTMLGEILHDHEKII